MKIRALQNFFMEGEKEFKAGEEYIVTEENGKTFIERQIAEEVSEKAPVAEPKPETSELPKKKRVQN